MKIFKLVIFLAAVIAVYVGVWFAFTSGHVDLNRASEAPDLSEQERAEVQTLLNRFNNGWNDAAFQSVKRYLAQDGHQTETAQLQDHIYTRLINILDSVVTAQYTSEMRLQPFEDNLVLANNYRGIDSVAVNYVQGASNARVILLRDTRDLYREIYGFATISYRRNPQLEITIPPSSGNGQIWRWRADWRDYSGFMNQRKGEGRELRARQQANELLRNVDWMQRELADATIAGKSQERDYIRRERQQLIERLNAIPTDSANAALAEQLTRMRSGMPQWLLQQEGVGSTLDAVIRRLTPAAAQNN